MSDGKAAHKAIPVLRVEDAVASASWFARLGFFEDWRHQHEPGFPWFVSVSTSDGATLFLSEHSGDASPAGSVYLVVRDIFAAAASCDVEPTQQPWGDLEFIVLDPDGNQIRVGQPTT